MIRLTLPSGDYVYINPDRIDNIAEAPGDMTAVCTAKEEIEVVEYPEEVVRKIMEHKTLMKRYEVLLSCGTADEHLQTGQALWYLAGLEADSK